MAKRLFVGLVCSLTSIAMADMSGTWSGKGKAWDNTGFKAECNRIKVELKQTDSTLDLGAIRWDCEDAGFTWSLKHYTHKEGKLYDEGTEVGTISNDRIVIIKPELEFPVAITLDNKVDVLHFKEEWLGKEVKFSVEGELQTQQ